jgi:hypothetical protein
MRKEELSTACADDEMQPAIKLLEGGASFALQMPRSSAKLK